MDSVGRYVRQQGVPLTVCPDKHTTYQSLTKPTMDEHLARTEPGSQFGRTLNELGVELIPAPAPQAKGRIERRFNTFQDRVIKDMRLAGVSTLDVANHIWGASQLHDNQRFTVQPTQAVALHRPSPARRELDRILQIQTPRCLRKGFTLAQQGGLYEIHDNSGHPRAGRRTDL